MYVCVCGLVGFIAISEPVYAGEEHVTLLHAHELEQKLKMKKNKKQIVFMFATWCPPCSQVAPIFAQLSLEYDELN